MPHGLQLSLRPRLLLLDLVPQHPSQDLAGLRLGHLLDEPDAAAQLLRRRDPLVEPGYNLLCLGFAGLLARGQDNVGARDLGVLLAVPGANDADVGDVLAADDFGLELGGGDLEALCGEDEMLVQYLNDRLRRISSGANSTYCT